MKKLSHDMKKNLKSQFLDYPSKSDLQISKDLGIAQSTVSKYRKEIDAFYDIEFVKATAGEFIKEFGQAADYWRNQISKLEELKNQDRTIWLTNKETGGSFEKQVPLSPMEKLAIEKHQTELKSKIVHLAMQGKAREVLKMMRSGDISALTE